MTRTPNGPRRAVAVAVIALLAVTACQNTPTDNPSAPKPTSPTPSQSPKPPTENETTAATYRAMLNQHYGVTVPGSDHAVYKQLKEICERGRDLGQPAARRWAQYGPLNINHRSAIDFTASYARGTCR